MKYLRLVLIIIPIAVAVFFYANLAGNARHKIVYTEHLDEIAVTVDGEDVTLEDMIFYVLFQESKVEGQARIYNPDSPKDYWNAHTNGSFLQLEVKDAIMGMVIHDRIMYNLALDNQVVLSTDEKNEMEKSRTKFWEGLYDGQLEKLPLEYEDGNRVIKEIALAEAYQQRLYVELQTTYAGLNWDGYDFQNILKEHDVKINDKLWDRVVVGDISLTHDNINYINGLTNEDKERMREKKK